MKLKNLSLLLALLPALALSMAGQKRNAEDQDGTPKKQATEQLTMALEPADDAPKVKLFKLFQLFNFLGNGSSPLQSSWYHIVHATVSRIGYMREHALARQLFAITKSPKINDIDENELCRFISELLSQDPTCVYETTKASCQQNNTDVFCNFINMGLFKASQLLLENNCCFFQNIFTNIQNSHNEQVELYFYQELLRRGASIEAFFAANQGPYESNSPYYPATWRYLLSTYQFPQSVKDSILINFCNEDYDSDVDTENACIAVEHGANFHNSALVDAVCYDKKEIVSYFISQGANVNIIYTGDDRTLLMIAIKKKNIDMVLTLLAAGADPFQRNEAGENALDFAKARRASPENLQIQKILRDAILGLHTYQLKKPDPMQQ